MMRLKRMIQRRSRADRHALEQDEETHEQQEEARRAQRLQERGIEATRTNTRPKLAQTFPCIHRRQ